MKKLAVSLLAALAASSVWAIQGTLTPDGGAPIRGDIKWKPASKKYTIEYKKGPSVISGEFTPQEVASLDIPAPAALDKAVELVAAGQGASAIPMLAKIAAEYKMLVWDKPAARHLVDAYLAANNPQKAEEVARGIIADDKDAAFTGEFAPSYWQILLKLGKTSQLENLLKKAVATGDRATSAAALVMRGDIILAQGGDNADTYNKALVDAFLRVGLMYTDEPCREVRATALMKAAQCFDKLHQASRAEDMRARAKAI